MAAHPIVVVDDDLIEKLPEQFKSDPRYQKGAKLELVPVSASDDVVRRLKELAGSWSHSPVDPNTILDAERQKELADEARWRE